MKKIYFLVTFLVLAGFGLQAQQTIFSDGFESYTVGQKLAQQAGDPWSTWSNNPGSAEDPVVSDTQANDGNNSAKVASGNDCVLLLGDSISGRYKLSFYIYVPAGKYGYYNLLANFAGSNSDWAVEVFFDAGGEGIINAGDATFSYNYDEWIYVENYVDLTNDLADIFVNGDHVIGWQWTLGGTPQQLGAANFYAWDANGSPEYYLDDVLFEEMPLGEAPTNLVAEVNETTVSLSWDPPANDIPDTYYVSRNGEVIAIQPDLTLEDVLELPGTYTYKVQAFYADYGLSTPSNEVEVIIEGGTERDLVLVEIGTGTWCTYCPGAAMGADELVEEGHPVAVIEYHGGDIYETSQSMGRINYYNLGGYPTAWFDGGNTVSGGSHDNSMYPTYEPIVNERETEPSWFELDLDVQVAAKATDFSVTVTATNIYDYGIGTNMSIFLVLTESNIPDSWQGMSEVDFACREMYPNDDGTPTVFELDVTETVEYSISVDYELNNCELVAFVQDLDTKEVMQTQKVNLGQVVGVKEEGESFTRIYPNPASGSVNIESASNIKHISIFNLSGQKVYEVSLDQNSINLNIDFLNQGMYMIDINTDNGRRIEKLSVR